MNENQIHPEEESSAPLQQSAPAENENSSAAPSEPTFVPPAAPEESKPFSAAPSEPSFVPPAAPQGVSIPYPPMQEKKKKKKKPVFWVLFFAVLYLVLIAGLLVLISSGALKFSSEPFEEKNEPAVQTEEGKTQNEPIKENPSEDGKNPIVSDGYTGEVLTATELYKTNVESVVFVEATYRAGKGTGSGFVIDSENGYILTNYHVVEGSDDVAVTFSNGDSYTAEILGGDEINDVAVLKISAKDLKNVTIGNSDDVQIGDDVLVIGNPLGDLTFTLTKGIVSGVDRAINTGEYTIQTFQTDAAINSGNSGGPAFDASGAVVGIASAKYAATGVEGIGFCIPINDAMRIAKDLVEFGYVKGRPNFGITVSDSSGYEYTTDEWGRRVVVETMRGARVEEVGKGSCAEKAGLKAGDIITKIEDKTIATANELINAKNAYKAGDKVTLEVFRNSEKITLTVELDEYEP